MFLAYFRYCVRCVFVAFVRDIAMFEVFINLRIVHRLKYSLIATTNHNIYYIRPHVYILLHIIIEPF